jgi:hypothetical protein
MPAVYQNLGVRFLYPENWAIQEEEPDEWPRTVTLQSEQTSFWSLYLYPPGHDARAAVTDVINTIRELYADLEVLPAKETIGDIDTKGVDIAFFYLDLLVEAKIRCVQTPSALVLWHAQAESREFDQMNLVFQALATSLLSSQIAATEYSDQRR